MGQQTVKRILHKVNLNYFPTICIPNAYISAMRLFQYLFPYIFLDLSNWFRTLYFWQFVRICLSRTHKDQGSLHQDSVKTSIVVLHNFIFDFIFELSLSVQTTIVLYFWLRRHEYIKNSSLIHVILPKVCKALNFWKSIISSSNVVEVYLWLTPMIIAFKPKWSFDTPLLQKNLLCLYFLDFKVFKVFYQLHNALRFYVFGKQEKLLQQCLHVRRESRIYFELKPGQKWSAVERQQKWQKLS